MQRKTFQKSAKFLKCQNQALQLLWTTPKQLNEKKTFALAGNVISQTEMFIKIDMWGAFLLSETQDFPKLGSCIYALKVEQSVDLYLLRDFLTKFSHTIAVDVDNGFNVDFYQARGEPTSNSSLCSFCFDLPSLFNVSTLFYPSHLHGIVIKPCYGGNRASPGVDFIIFFVLRALQARSLIFPSLASSAAALKNEKKLARELLAFPLSWGPNQISEWSENVMKIWIASRSVRFCCSVCSHHLQVSLISSHF